MLWHTHIHIYKTSNECKLILQEIFSLEGGGGWWLGGDALDIDM